MNIKRRIKTDLVAIALILAIAFSLLTIGYRIGEIKTRQKEWTNNRKVTTYTVESGHTLWNISSQYKPEWLDTREYIHEIKALNNTTDSNINEGDIILVYIY